MRVVAPLIYAAFAIGGRWIQLCPERVVPKGYFTGANTTGARFFRVQIAILGTFAVFAGTWLAVFSLLSLLTFGSSSLGWIAQLMGIVAGIVVAVLVRKEAKTQPPYISKSPYGWWP
jgi:membrane associated rhomboid family serine protease